jgi:hypothetical protein
MPVGDSTLGQVIGRQFDGNAVASHHLDPIPAKSSRHRREYRLARVQFDRKHSGPEFFYNFAHHFYGIFFRQTFLQSFHDKRQKSLPLLARYGAFRRSMAVPAYAAAGSATRQAIGVRARLGGQRSCGSRKTEIADKNALHFSHFF